MLVWDLIFIRSVQNNQKIMFHREFENGVLVQKKLADQQAIFLNYIALFPNKDIVRIKLGLNDAFLYSFYYVDKRFKDLGFIGIFGASEYNENEPYDWPETEIIAKNIFANFFKRLIAGKMLTVEENAEFLKWLDEQILECFYFFKEQKEKFYTIIRALRKETLMSTFQTLESKHSYEPKPQKPSKRKKSASKKVGVSDEKSTLVSSSEEDPDPETFPEDTSQIQISSSEYGGIDGRAVDWNRVRTKFELQIISAFGTPLTKIFTFINGEFKNWWTQEDSTSQSLEGMTYSVLNTFVDQQEMALTLRSMKLRKPEDEGYEFIVFETFHSGDLDYLIILNVDHFSMDEKASIDVMRGTEEQLLANLSSKFKDNPAWFSPQGDFSSPAILEEVNEFIIDEVKQAFIK